MRVAPSLVLAIVTTTVAGCNTILDIREHPVARAAGADAGPIADAGSGPPSASLPPYPALYTVGRVPDEASVGYLSDGGRVTLSDDGFEPGGTLCKQAICVTGALTP